MRYENWDVLLFPGSDHVPLREFRTECHVVPDPESLPLSRFGVPTLSTFVPSLQSNSPFSISILSWGKPPISQSTRSYSNHPELVLFEFHVYIDGRLVSTAILDQNMKGPYSIQHSFVLTRDGEIDSLRFPAFHSGEILQQRFWNPGDEFGRIKITLTESFPRDSVTLPFERIKNAVTFSFQHAPLEILESSAIAWPNPTMWQSVLSDNMPLKAELSEPPLQRHIGLSNRNSATNTTSSRAVLSALTSLQSLTNPDVPNEPDDPDENRPSSAQGCVASACSPNSYIMAQDFAASHLDTKEQCGQVVRSSFTCSTHSAANNVHNPSAIGVKSRSPYGTPFPSTRALSSEFIPRHLDLWASRMHKTALPAAQVISRKECRATQHSVETASLNNVTNTTKPGVGQKRPKLEFASIDNTTIAKRTPSLQIQSRRLVEVPETIRRSASSGATTNTEKQEAGLSTKRGQGTRNFTPLCTHEVAGGMQLHG